MKGTKTHSGSDLLAGQYFDSAEANSKTTTPMEAPHGPENVHSYSKRHVDKGFKRFPTLIL